MLVKDEKSVGTPGTPAGSAGGANGIAGAPKLLRSGHAPNCGAPDTTKAKVAKTQTLNERILNNSIVPSFFKDSLSTTSFPSNVNFSQ
jgi:hypothetical protein